MSRTTHVGFLTIDSDLLLLADEAECPVGIDELDEHPEHADILAPSADGGSRVALGVGPGDYAISVRRNSQGRIVRIVIDSEEN